MIFKRVKSGLDKLKLIHGTWACDVAGVDGCAGPQVTHPGFPLHALPCNYLMISIKLFLIRI